MVKLLIADCNEDFALALSEVLQAHYQVLFCRDGETALALLRKESPAVLVLDLMLPGIDGLTLMERAAAEEIRPKTLVFDSLMSSYVQESIQRLSISYVMRKPCQISAVAERIRDISRQADPRHFKQDPAAFVTGILIALGLRTNHKGFGYLREAVLLLSTDPGQALTKETYPAVAKIFGCKPGHVERSIRSTLEVAWNHRNEQIWQQYFPKATRQPTNAVFLFRLAEELRNFQE